jgi:DNA repair exonuclease SbcCD ATPase subunit
MSELTESRLRDHLRVISESPTSESFYAYRDAVMAHDAALRARIAELEDHLARREEELEGYVWTISPAMAQAKIDQLNQRVTELDQRRSETVAMCEQLQQQLTTATQERDEAIRIGQENAQRFADREARLTEERDGWHEDASAHLMALCEKQAEVNALTPPNEAQP